MEYSYQYNKLHIIHSQIIVFIKVLHFTLTINFYTYSILSNGSRSEYINSCFPIVPC